MKNLVPNFNSNVSSGQYAIYHLINYLRVIPTIVLLSLGVSVSAEDTHTWALPSNSDILDNHYYVDEAVNQLVDYICDSDTQIKSTEVFHLFTHGRPGFLLIDGEWLDHKQIVNWFLGNEILSSHSHLNIYGCNFARGTIGEKTISYIEKALCVSVAASDDITGIDGDWELEIGHQINRLKIFNYQENLQLDNSNWNPDGSECIENILLYPGVAAITCSVVQDQPANERYVVAFLSMNGTHSVTGRTNITDTDSVLHHTDWLVENIGNVFGTEINQNTGEVFVTASSNYASSIGVNNISGTILLVQFRFLQLYLSRLLPFNIGIVRGINRKLKELPELDLGILRMMK